VDEPISIAPAPLADLEARTSGNEVGARPQQRFWFRKVLTS
jgi:hypothetical protein